MRHTHRRLQTHSPPSSPHPWCKVNVNLLRRDEEYQPPAQPRVKAFSGTGYKLSGGDDAPGSSSAAGPPPEANLAPGAVTWEGADLQQPTTSIQLRLADGSRLRATFNLSHTVADIRRCAAVGMGLRVMCRGVCSHAQGWHEHGTRQRPPIHSPSKIFLRRFIIASRPDMAGRAFRLATAFPPSQLDDDSQTVEAAGLANAVVVQKL